VDKQHVVESIYRAIDELNQQLPAEKRLSKMPDTPLYTRSGTLDSLGIVNLILFTEESLEQEFGVQIDLSSKLNSSSESNPLRDVNTFADYISSLIWSTTE
jgi:acyl carrier protein